MKLTKSRLMNEDWMPRFPSFDLMRYDAFAKSTATNMQTNHELNNARC